MEPRTRDGAPDLQVRGQRQIRWGRVLVGGLLAELLVLAIGLSARAVLSESALLTTVLLVSGLAPFLAMLWVGRRVASHFVLHGALVGLVAAVLYVAFASGRSQPANYQVAGMKFLGGAIGGFISFRLKRTARRPTSGAKPPSARSRPTDSEF